MSFTLRLTKSATLRCTFTVMLIMSKVKSLNETDGRI
jgi:hypothetical protein